MYRIHEISRGIFDQAAAMDDRLDPQSIVNAKICAYVHKISQLHLAFCVP